MSSPESHEAQYFDTVYGLLPSSLKNRVDGLLSSATCESTVRYTLDQLVRFSLGKDATDYDLVLRKEWDAQKPKLEEALANLCHSVEKTKKRAREEDVPDASELNSDPKAKKLKIASGDGTDSGDDPVFTLHAVSVSSPVRKKVNITIHHNTIRFTHATSGVQEASIQLSALTRAFQIATPGKSKPHWTVIILTDVEQNQIIFGLDAVSPLTTTTHPALPHSTPRGTETKPALTQFLSHLPSTVSLQEPSTSQFRSASGEPFLDVHLRAKDGHLLFFTTGILFGEKKPCIWIGVEEIESVRCLSATGRTFSIFVKRVSTAMQEDDDDEEGEETEFSLIDGKNQDAVARWVQDNRHRFGVQRGPTNTDVDELADDEDTPEKKEEDSEDLDSDFHGDSESDGGSATSDSSGVEDADGEDGAEEQSGLTDEEEEEQFDPSRHPLLRPGAMPKMSKAAMDAVVGMVEEDLMGGSLSNLTEVQPEDDDDEDQLED